jgi:hypothetical protein
MNEKTSVNEWRLERSTNYLLFQAAVCENNTLQGPPMSMFAAKHV